MKASLWILGITALIFAGVAAYEFAYIQHLLFIVRFLAGGSPN